MPLDKNSIFSYDKNNNLQRELPIPVYGNLVIFLLLSAILLIIFSIAKNEKQIKLLFKSFQNIFKKFQNKKDDYISEDDFKLEEEFRYKKLTDI